MAHGAGGWALAFHRWGSELASRSLHVSFVVDGKRSATNFIQPFLHIHRIHFVSFHPTSPCDGATSGGWPAPLLFIHLQYMGFVASHPSIRPNVGHELRMLFFLYCRIEKIYPGPDIQPALSAGSVVRSAQARK